MGLLQALVLVSLSTRLGDDQARGFASCTPYDLRRHFLPEKTPDYPDVVPGDAMCNCVSVFEHDFGLEVVARTRKSVVTSSSSSSSSFYSSSSCARQCAAGDGGNDGVLSAGTLEIAWSVASRVRVALGLESVLFTNPWTLASIMRFAGDWLAQQQGKVLKPRHLSWLVTNLGVLDGGAGPGGRDEGCWSIRRAELVLSAEVPSAALSVSVKTVKGGQMRVALSWQDCAVDRQLGEGLRADLETWLRQIGGAERGR